MKRLASLLLLLAAAGMALAQAPLTPTPEDAVPQRPWLQGLTADQRAAWFNNQRARQAEAERDEARELSRDLARRLIESQNAKRDACT